MCMVACSNPRPGRQICRERHAVAGITSPGSNTCVSTTATQKLLRGMKVQQHAHVMYRLTPLPGTCRRALLHPTS